MNLDNPKVGAPMFFYCDQLSTIAPQHFQATGADLRFVEVKHQNLNRHVLQTQDIGSEIVLQAVGSSITLRFHVHAWCGAAVVVHNGRVSEIDLYRPEHGYEDMRFQANAQGQIDLRIICGAGHRHPDAKGDQTWLVGVAFDAHQPWLPSCLPVSRSCDIAFAQRGTFLVHTNDSIIGREIAARGVWAAHDVKFFEQHIRPGMAVLDIGSNIGHHLVVFAKLVGPGGYVAGFEPQRVLFRLATANLALNDCHNADILPMCLGDADGHVNMFPIDYEARNNFGALGVDRDADAPSAAGERVPVRTLDGVMRDELAHLNRLDFIKIDVQSYELFVLKGGINTIQRFKPKLFLEISPHWMRQRGYDYLEIYALLEGIGYQFIHTGQDSDVDPSAPRAWNGQSTDEWDVFAFVPA